MQAALQPFAISVISSRFMISPTTMAWKAAQPFAPTRLREQC